VTGVLGIPPAFVREQIDTLFGDVRIDAVKIGMVGQAPVIRAVADALAHWKPGHVVLDPVMIAKSGDALLETSAVGALIEALVPLATVLTPNLPEAGVLLGQRGPETISEMRRAAEKLRERMAHDGSRWVVLKGGHLPGSDAIDVVTDGDRMIELGTKRIDTKNTHGTGCTLSAAIAALLPVSPDPPTAIRRAKDYLVAALAAADALDVGRGHGRSITSTRSGSRAERVGSALVRGQRLLDRRKRRPEIVRDRMVAQRTVARARRRSRGLAATSARARATMNRLHDVGSRLA
jgi:hydroxymethylpyrimidine/phosphomethylpyrimidine kinase